MAVVLEGFERFRLLELDRRRCLLVLRVFSQVVDLVTQHEVQVLQQFDLFEVELALVVD